MSASPVVDAFVSYSHRDATVVAPLAARLRAAGLSLWFDADGTDPGDRFVHGIDRGLRTAAACLVCVGPGEMGTFARRELEIAVTRNIDDAGFRLVPVLLPGVERDLVSTELPSLFLAPLTWIDLRDGVDDEDAVAELVAVLKGDAGLPQPLGAGAVPGAGTTAPPYPGLDPFAVDDPRFFGRSVETASVLDKLVRHPVLAVVGPSGSGKSSLVLAGVVPALAKQAVRGAHDWVRLVVRPRTDPFLDLADALAGPLGRSAADVDAELGSSPRALTLALAALRRTVGSAHGIVLVVDQFEELFTLTAAPLREQWLDAFFEALAHLDDRTLVVLTLRADFYASVAEEPRLRELVADHQYLLGPMTAEGLREAIELPARRGGLEFQPRLVDAILDDVAHQRGALPLLAHALYETWERRRGNRMTLGGYLEAGGVKGAIGKRADDLLRSLQGELPDVDALARRVLTRLARVGDGTADTSHPAERDDLVGSGDDPAVVHRIIAAFAGARLLTMSRRELPEQVVVEVAHEALIRSWPRMRQWLHEDVESTVAREQLTDATDAWERSGRDDAFLYRGSRLAQAEALRDDRRAELTVAELAFVERSVEARRAEADAEQERAVASARARVLRRAVVGVSAMATVALLAAGMAGTQWRAASRARTQAASFQLAALGREAMSRSPDRAALLAAEAYRVDANPTTTAALLTSVTRPRGVLRVEGPGGARASQGSTSLAVSAFADAASGSVLTIVGPDGQVRESVGRPVVDVTAVSGELVAWADASGSVSISQPGAGVARALGTMPQRVSRLAADVSSGLVVAVASSADLRTSEVRAWDAVTGREAGGIEVEGAVSHVATSGGQVVFASADAPSVWQWAPGADPVAVPMPDAAAGDGRVMSLAVSGALVHVLFGSALVTIDPAYGVASRLALPAPGNGTAVAAAADGPVVAIATDAGTVLVADPSSGRIETALRADPPPEALVSAGSNAVWVAVSLDAEEVVGLRVDGRRVRWSRSAASALGADLATPTAVLALAPGAPGFTATLVNGATQTVGGNGAMQASGTVALDGATPRATSPDGALVLVRRQNGEFALLGEGAPTGTFPLEARADAVAVAPGGAAVAFGTDAGDLVVWWPSRAEAAQVAAHERPVGAVAFSDDGTLLASAKGDSGHEVRLWRVGEGSVAPIGAAATAVGGPVSALVFGPDGSLWSGGDDRTLVAYAVPELRERQRIVAAPEQVQAIAISPDTAIVAAVHDGGVLVLWDANGGVPLLDPVQVAGSGAAGPFAVAFSADGASVAASVGARVLVLPTVRSSWVSAACVLGGRDLTPTEWALAAQPGDVRPCR